MSTQTDTAKKGDILLEMRGLRIEGRVGEEWNEIVHGTDVTLRKGEVLGLIGESGAGKSTIGLAAMGFARDGCRISGGTIMFKDGEKDLDLAKASDEELRKLRGSRIAYVAQSAAAAFNPAHKLIEQYCEAPVQHGIKSRSEAAADAIDLYGRLQLPDPENIGFRYPHQVSGGQLQRAMTAMAMASRPSLIIFDEPTTALDVTTQIEVLSAIREIVEQFDTAAIYITHDLAVVSQMADRIQVLRWGKLIEEGETRQIVEDPQKEYTRELLAVRTFRKPPVNEPKPDVPLLKMDNITAAYGNKMTVLFDVSMEIHKKRTVAVVGESGSGKSTAARVITGLLPPIEGEISYDGVVLPRDFRQRNKGELRRLQMIYQMPDTALNPKQRVREIIGRPLEFYLAIHGAEKEKRVRDLLDMIEMQPDYANRYPSELSGGQKQRICIARALAAEPELIICDEVTSALDQLVAEEILKLLQRLQNELELAYMFITHDLATVKAIADEIVVMLQGRVVEQGEKQDILTPPHHEYTELLLSSVPEMDPDWLDGVLAARKAAAQ